MPDDLLISPSGVPTDAKPGDVFSTVPASDANPGVLPSPQHKFDATTQPPSFFETFSAAFQDNSISAAGLRWLNSEAIERDSNFRWTDEEFDELTAGIPTDLIDEFEGAQSFTHAEAIRQRVLDSMGRKSTIAEAGWTGMGLSMVSSILDPITLSAGLLSGGTAWAAGITKGAWAARAVKGALAGATAAGAEEAILNLEDPVRDYTDVLVAAAFGAAFGGGINTAAPKLRDAYLSVAGRGEARAMRKAGLPLSERGKAVADDVTASTPLPPRRADTPEAFEAISPGHKKFSQALKGFDAENLLGRSGVRAVRQILSVVDDGLLARLSPAAVDSIADASGNAVESALGSSRRAANGAAEINLRRTANAAQSKRQLATLLHEIGHDVHRDLGPELAEEFDSIVANLRDKNKLTPFVTALAGRDAGRDLARLSDPAELFGEVFAKSLIARYGGDAVRGYSKRLARQAEKYRDGASIDPSILSRIDEIVDQAAGVDPNRGRIEPNIVESPPTAAQPAVADELEEVLFDLESDTPDQLSRLESALRFDLSADMQSSTVDSIRSIGGHMLYNGVGDPNKVRKTTMEEAIGQQSNRVLVQYYSQINPALRSWAKSKGASLKDKISDVTRADYFEQVGQVLHLKTLPDGLDPHIITGVNATRKLMQDGLTYAAERGVPGAKETLKGGFNYRPRVSSQAKRLRAMNIHGKKSIVDWFQGSIISGSKKLNADNADDVKIARQMARGYVDRLEKFRGESALRINSGVAATSDELEEVLSLFKAEGKMTDADIAKAKDILTDPDDGRPAVFKARMPIDEDYLQKTDAGELKFSDLFETDAEKLGNYYTRVTTRETEAYNLRRRFVDPAKDVRKVDTTDEAGVVTGTEEVTVVPAWDTLMERTTASMKNIDEKTFKKESTRIKRLDDAYRILMGQIDESGGGHQAARLIMKSNFARIAGMFGIAQQAEVPIAVASQGMGVMIQSMPEFRRILKGGEKLLNDDDGLLSEIVGMGIGSEGWTHPSRLIQEVAGDLEWDRQMLTVADKAEQVLDKSGRLVSIVSGLQPITNWTRIAFANTLTQRIGMNALGEGKEMRVARMRDMGFDEAATEAVYAEFRKHAEFDGKKLIRMNVDKWDEGVASKFAYGVVQKTHSIVQHNHLGGQPKWFASSPVMKMLLQFRSFQIQAWTNHTLRGLKFHDMETFANFSAMLFGGGLSYVTYVGIKSIGQENPQAYIAERTTPERIAIGAFARGGFASIIPTVADTLGGTFFHFQPFANTRTSGLSQNLIMGIPTVDLLSEKLPGAVGAVPSSLRPDYDFSSEDLRNVRSLIPLQNLIGIDQMFRSIENSLPRRSQDSKAANNLGDLISQE